MCGRYSITTPVDALRRLFGFEGRPNLAPRYNVAPTQDAPVVRRTAEGEARELAMLRWGLIPSWAKDKDIGARMINARAETLAEKPSFRNAFRRRRCLVVADGFYEWQKTGNGKQPWRICLADGGPFAFAGLWEHWNGPDGPLQSFTIATTNANKRLAAIHDRMPVIVDPVDHERWLAEATPADELKALLKPFPADRLHAYKIDRKVGNVRNDDPSVIEPIE